jgi:hypothetical protein
MSHVYLLQLHALRARDFHLLRRDNDYCTRTYAAIDIDLRSGLTRLTDFELADRRHTECHRDCLCEQVNYGGPCEVCEKEPLIRAIEAEADRRGLDLAAVWDDYAGL